MRRPVALVLALALAGSILAPAPASAQGRFWGGFVADRGAPA